jgi:CIC family chloride channel protein
MEGHFEARHDTGRAEHSGKDSISIRMKRKTTQGAPVEPGGRLGDFTMGPRSLWISGLALLIGFVSAFVALALLRLIGIFTNLFFFGRWGTALVSPADNHLGILEIFVPVAGALIIGFMARYGSERIRGHGIPEAIESILISGSKVEPKVAVLKPLSSAISIGSGGPFGAEGPIIMTGAAFGSMIAQFFQLSSSERKTLLVAGAAAGMSATFASPVAAVLLAVELLLFEWKPRSLIPVALASVIAAATRRYLMGLGPLFPVPPHPLFIGPAGLAGCVVAGLLAGVLSAAASTAVYAAEDLFRRIPIHWMWWPAMGGLVVGLGGFVFPQALGVGYDTIGALLSGEVPRNLIFGILFVKSVIWAVSLGSGTSGGVLAPLLMMGGALGGVEAMFLPAQGPGFWPLVSMGAVLGGTMRAPLTGVVFALEVTHDVNMLVPLLMAVSISYAFSVLTLKRSILTEKVARRGLHLSCEYAVDPLEILRVRDVMRTNVVALAADTPVRQLTAQLHAGNERRAQRLYPVVDPASRLVGVATRRQLQEISENPANAGATIGSLLAQKPVVARADEPLRLVVNRMADTGLTRMPVVDPAEPDRLVGMVAINDLLYARSRAIDEERRRERVLRLQLPFTRHQAEELRTKAE